MGAGTARQSDSTGRVEGTERRGAVRFPIDQPARYKVLSRPSKETGSGRTVNISSTGVLFSAEPPLNLGERVELSVNWPAHLDNKQPLKLVTSGRVVRVNNGAAAMVIDRYEFRTQGAGRLAPQHPASPTA
jgi:hypothetical protein